MGQFDAEDSHQRHSERLLKYLRLAESSETFISMHADEPIAELRSVVSSDKSLRSVGLQADEVTVPNEFDALSLEDILSAFESK